jgi:hypothetical protein
MAFRSSGVRACGADGPWRPCRGPVRRRSVVTAGVLGLGGLCLGDIRRLQAAGLPGAKPVAADTSVIFVWLPGGPPHLDTYDMKPDAASEIRGPFRPIHTNVAGIDVCELLPRHAACADKYALIRSISHEFADHGGGHKRFLTGRDPKEPTGFVNDTPMAGSFLAWDRETRASGVPSYTALVDAGRAHVDTFSFGSAYLGPSYDPFIVAGDPSEAGFRVRNISIDAEAARRLGDRATLARSLDHLRRDLDLAGSLAAKDRFDADALSLLTSREAQHAFDLEQESEGVRDRYGRHRFGQRALLARRLIEAGAGFVTVVMEHPGGTQPTNGVYNWDSHAVNCHIFEDANWRFPYYDQAVTALIEDLYARGLDKKVLLVVTGEFGRTPRIEYQIGTQTKVMQPGRDHWPGAMSVLVSGGGLRTGQVVGSTDSQGGHPKDRPLTPNDLWATVYHHLGIDPSQSVLDLSGRPMPILPFGEPIAELMS